MLRHLQAAGARYHAALAGPLGALLGWLLQPRGSGVDRLALAGTSWAARRYLGLTGIEEGALADLVAYPDHPRGVPDVLDRPSLRILDGRVVSGA